MNNAFQRVMMRRAQLAAAVMFALVVSGLAFGIAQAHENRVIGKYRLTVGWLTEPALLNEPNSIDLRVIVSDTQKPVEGLDKTLKAEIISGASSTPVVLSARFGQPGAYNGNIIPTKAGTYIMHFTGMIEDMPIDAKFESGPGRYGDIMDTAALQFPVKVPAPADMAAQLKAAQDSAANAQTTAYVAVALGVLGLLAGGLGLMRRK
jgi:hypothetical protein